MWLLFTMTAALAAGQVDPDAGVEVDGGVAPQRHTVVVGERGVDVRRIAGSAQVIGREELERQESNDLNRVLQGVPGVYVREEDGFGLRPNISMRGVAAERSAKLTLMEDGVLYTPAPYSAPDAYFTPLITRMVGVEVYKGPAAIRFGPQTIGGALNLRTREVPRQLEVDGDVAMGNYGYAKFHGVVGYGTENLGALVEYVHLGSTGFKQLDGGGNTGFDKNELMLKGRWVHTFSDFARQEVQLKLGLSTEESHETYLGISNADFAVTPYRRYAASQLDDMKWWRTQGVLTHRLWLGENFQLKTDVYRLDFTRTWFRVDHFRRGPDVYETLAFSSDPQRAQYAAILAGEADSVGRDQQLLLLDNHRVFVSQGVQSVGTFKAVTGPITQELEVGVRFHHDDILRVHSQNGYDMRGGALAWNGEAPEVINDNTAWTRSFSAHVSDSLQWGNLLVSPGVRLEIFDAYLTDRTLGTRAGQLSVVPLLGLGAVYSFDFGLSALAGVHQGFSPPTPGQAGALPERAINSEAGLRFSRRGLRLEAIGFWSEYENIVGSCNDSSGCLINSINQQFNGGHARVLGVEALAGLRGTMFWGLRGAVELTYTLTSAKFLTDFVSQEPSWGSVRAGYELPYIPVHQGQLRLRVSKGPVELGLGGMYYGEVREIAGYGPIEDAVRVPARFILDATASFEAGPVKFYFTGTNLTNQAALVSRRPLGARPQAPFMAQFGLKYAFR